MTTVTKIISTRVCLSARLVEDVESFNTTIQEAMETAEDRREVCVFCASKRRPFSGSYTL